MLMPWSVPQEGEVRQTLATQIMERPCWTVVLDGALKTRKLAGTALAPVVHDLLTCRRIIIRRRHSRLYGPIIGVRVLDDGTHGVLAFVLALDEPPWVADRLTPWVLNGLNATLFGLAHQYPELSYLALPQELQTVLPTLTELRTR